MTFVGDSITQRGWYHNITDKNYFPKLVTINKGSGGNTTTDVIHRLPDTKSNRPNMFVLAIGVNDARKSGVMPAYSETYINNINTIVKDLRTVAPVVIIGPWRTFWKDRAYDGPAVVKKRVDDWNKSLEIWSIKNNFLFINPNGMLDKEIVPNNVDRFVPDGVHPNDRGERLYIDAVLYGKKRSGTTY